MDRSYLYIKRFIDEEVKKLNQPLKITESLKRTLSQKNENNSDEENNELSEKQLQQILNKVNVKIKRHNRNVFCSQVKNQIVQQVLKAEQQKLLVINEKLMKIKVILKPILLPDFNELSNEKNRLGEFDVLIRQLPESKYLFIGEAEEEEISDSGDTEESDHSSNEILVQDEQERVEKPVSNKKAKLQYKRSLIASINDKFNNEESVRLTKELLNKYDETRRRLIRLNNELNYRHDKLTYLQSLKDDLTKSFNLSVPAGQTGYDIYDSDEDALLRSNSQIEKIQSNLISSSSSTTTSHMNPDANLFNEINRFRILVEKIGFKLNSSHNKRELTNALHKLNRNE